METPWIIAEEFCGCAGCSGSEGAEHCCVASIELVVEAAWEAALNEVTSVLAKDLEEARASTSGNRMLINGLERAIALVRRIPIYDRESVMFRCDECKRVTEPTEKSHKKVMQTRDVVYEGKYAGEEIVKEHTVCASCINK